MSAAKDVALSHTTPPKSCTSASSARAHYHSSSTVSVSLSSTSPLLFCISLLIQPCTTNPSTCRPYMQYAPNATAVIFLPLEVPTICCSFYLFSTQHLILLYLLLWLFGHVQPWAQFKLAWTKCISEIRSLFSKPP